MCGHWFWDNDEPANIVCRQLGCEMRNPDHASFAHSLTWLSSADDHGYLFTFGTSLNMASLPTVLGFRECSGSESSLAECTEMQPKGIPPAPQCFVDPLAVDGCNSGCSHAIDQGAICYSSQQDSNLQEWAHAPTQGLSAAVRMCGGCEVGCHLVNEVGVRADAGQTLFFGCIDFFSARCTFDATSDARNYQHALNEFKQCAENGAHLDGYCHGSLKNAAMLRNQDVCKGGPEQVALGLPGGSNTNIAFHIRIPFFAEVEQTIHFRYHGDFGLGSFIGVDGAEHTPGNLWGHVQVSDVSVSLGDHEFEALGFENCCDGHSELEIHLPCDAVDDEWRVVTSGGSICMSCDWTGGAGFSAKVSVVVDNSHDTYCNGQLIGSGNSWNTPDTFNCDSDDGDYVIGIDGVDGEVGRFGYGALMASIKTSTGETMNTVGVNPYVRGYGLTPEERRGGFGADATPDLLLPRAGCETCSRGCEGDPYCVEVQRLTDAGTPPWRCWLAPEHGAQPPAGWEQKNFDDSSWPIATDFGRNDDDNTHWAQHIPVPAGSTGGHVKPGITDEAQWIWSPENDQQNDVFCRGVLLRDRSGDTDTSGQPASCSAGTTAAATCGGVGGEMRCGAIQSVTNGTPRVRLSDYPQGRIEIWKEDGQGGGSWGARRPNLPPRSGSARARADRVRVVTQGLSAVTGFGTRTTGPTSPARPSATLAAPCTPQDPAPHRTCRSTPAARSATPTMTTSWTAPPPASPAPTMAPAGTATAARPGTPQSRTSATEAATTPTRARSASRTRSSSTGARSASSCSRAASATSRTTRAWP